MVLHIESGRKLPKHLRHEEIPRHIYTPRTYQVQLLDFALHQNSILCVGNEESKAFLVAMLVKEMLSKVREGQRGRHIVLLVHEGKAGHDMAKILMQHVNANVAVYDSQISMNMHDMNEHHVLVFTADLFLEILKAGLLCLSCVNLLVFDECHHSTNVNHPYVEIMQIYANLGAEQPKILALTTSFLTDKLQTQLELNEKITNLEQTFHATAETANLVMGDRYGSPPEQKITICKSRENEASVTLSGQIIRILLTAMQFLDDFQDDEENTEDGDVCNVPLRALIVCWDILGELGSWCAASAAKALIKQLEKIMAHEKCEIAKTLLLMTATQLRHIYELFDEAFKDVYTVDRFLDFVSPKVVELLETLRLYKPDEDFTIIEDEENSCGDFSDSDSSDDMSDMSDDANRHQKFVHVAVKTRDVAGSSQEDLFESDNGKKLCALVFVDKRNVAQFLFKLIDELCAWDENLYFVKSRYVVGARGRQAAKEASIVVKKEEEILKKFRMQELNLLVCTSVLEEGVDIPRCNLVVKFTPPANYRSYTLSKSRARASKSQFIMLVDESESEIFQKNITDYMAIQQVLKARCHNPDLTYDQYNDDIDTDQMPPYVPCSDRPSVLVSLQTAIAHINRYCAKLPSDSFTHLTPICRVVETCDEFGDTQFTAYLRLPINSTVKDEIKGAVMRSRRSAQKAVALKACEILHREGELDDNLLPVGKEVFRYEDDEEFDEEDSEGLARAGTAKRKRYYFKQVPQILTKSHPKPNVPCVLYDIDYRLTGPITEEQNSRGRQIYVPENSLRGFGILIAHRIPQVPKFPIYTRSGEVTVSIDRLSVDVRLTDDNLDVLHKFHKFLFSNVLRLQKDPMEYHPYENDVSYIIVPVCKDSFQSKPTIDWDFIKKVETSVSQSGKNKFLHNDETFKFDTELFEDAVVMPSYRNVDQPQYFYVAEICYDLSPLSPFPSPDLYKTFEKYYETKYDLKITQRDQPLLDVDHTSARLNLLTPRYMNQKGMVLPTCSSDTKRARRENLQQKQILIPELCDIHVFPASLWRKAVCLPAILYRVSSLLITEQMRVKIAHETDIGKAHLDADFGFPPLDFGFETCPEKLPSPGPLVKNNGTASFFNVCNNCNDPAEGSSDDHGHMHNGKQRNVVTQQAASNQTDNCDNLQSATETSATVSHECDNLQSATETSATVSHECDNLQSATETSATVSHECDNLQSATESSATVSHEFNSNDCDKFDVKHRSENSDAETFRQSGDESHDCNEQNLENKLKSLCINGAVTNVNHISSLLDKRSDESSIIQMSNGELSNAQFKEFDGSHEPDQTVKDSFLSESKSHTPQSHLSKKFTNAPKSCVHQKPLVVFDESVDMDVYVGPSPCTILQAITMSNANDFFSLERLETIGDSYLKYAITVYLYCTYPGIHEGKLSYLRSKQVSNYNLYRLGKWKGFPEAVISSKFEPSENWLPPGYRIDENQRKGQVPKVTISATTETTFKYLDSIAESVQELQTTQSITSPLVTKESKSSKNSKTGSKNTPATKSFDFAGLKTTNEFGISHWMGEEAESNAVLGGSAISHSSEQYQQFRREFDDLAWIHDAGKACVAYSLRTQHCVPDKSVADCVEALLGCYLISGGNRVALLFMSWLGLKVLPRKHAESSDNVQIAQQFDELRLPPSPLIKHTSANSPVLDHLLSGLPVFEEKIGYTFNDKSYLLQAFTHASYYHNVITDCYQRLEFLGDAILDYVITRHLYEDSRKYSPGVLTDLRSALVNNNIFAALAVKWDFHMFFKTFSPALYHVVSKFVAWQKENEDCISLDEDFSGEDQNAPEMEIPKALGDIFESVAGAIYLDSGMSLDTVWVVYYKMMKPLIQKYLESIPKSPVRELLEMEPETAQFEKPERTMEGKIRVTVSVVGKGEWTGVGRNYRIAKSAAAKKALKSIKCNQAAGVVS